MRQSPTKKFFLILACFLYSCTNQNIEKTAIPLQLPSNEKTEEVIYSPDGLWVAKRFIGQSSINLDRIEIQNISGSVVWNIPFEGVILEADGEVWVEIPKQGEEWKGEPNPSIYIFEWSHDSQYLYFNYRLFADGYQPLMDKYDLQRINVTTGVIEKVLSGTGRMDFMFSPNQEYLVFTRRQDVPRQIIIRKTSDGTEQSISSPEWDKDAEIGGFDWSPYQNNILRFLTFSEDWEQIQVYTLDIQDTSIQLNYEFWRDEFYFDSWTPNNSLRYITFPAKEITEINIAMPTPNIIGTATLTSTP